jgi:hypothetical protein
MVDPLVGCMVEALSLIGQKLPSEHFRSVSAQVRQLGSRSFATTGDCRTALHDIVYSFFQSVSQLDLYEAWYDKSLALLLTLQTQQFEKRFPGRSRPSLSASSVSSASSSEASLSSSPAASSSTSSMEGASDDDKEERLSSSDDASADATGVLCPITRQPCVDPVLLTDDGHVYERDAIEQWLRIKAVSPLTNAQIVDGRLIPVYSLRDV